MRAGFWRCSNSASTLSSRRRPALRSSEMIRPMIMALALLFCVGADPALSQQPLPAKFADDPVAKALGPDVFNAALKEGKVVWYGATTTQDFFEKGGQEKFQRRFGIKLELINGRLRVLTDRLRTESAVG